MSETSPNPDLEILFLYPSKKGDARYTAGMAWSFLHGVLRNKKLSIAEHLDKFHRVSAFFLIAGTGLGKTVAMPIYLWFHAMYFTNWKRVLQHHDAIPVDTSPRIWVIEPKIAIVQDLHREMNREWSMWKRKSENPSRENLFGCKTKTDHQDLNAPIMFITTGIFAIYARKGMFKAGRDIILIDEAHETLESDPAVELGLGICRGLGMTVHYMSATVEHRDLPAQLGVKMITIPGKRFPVWRHNLGRPIEECIVQLVESTLVYQRRESEYFPRGENEIEQSVLTAVMEQDRAKGMLVIVNSFSGKRSDAKKLERILRSSSCACDVEIGLLASEVRRDPERRAAYEDMIERWKREKCRYVLIATSVVEMGITLPDLDFIVTMDSTINDENKGGFFERIPLRTNSLVQRMGRVGRLRPGIAYISREVEAPYTELDDQELNAPNALHPEPIRFPFAAGSLDWIAYESLARSWSDSELEQKLKKEILLPSMIQDSEERRTALLQARQKFEICAAAEDEELTEDGQAIERWIGRIEPKYAIRIYRAICKGRARLVLQSVCHAVESIQPIQNMCGEDEIEKHPLTQQRFQPAMFGTAVISLGEKRPPTRSTRRMRQWIDEQLSLPMEDIDLREQTWLRALALLEEFMQTIFDAYDLQPWPTTAQRLQVWHQSVRLFLRWNR